MRTNLTKKDLVNQVYMQLGFSKQVSENLINDFLATIIFNIKIEKKLKLSKFGTFTIRQKKSRIGRNPKTKEVKIISSRDVVLFKPSKEFKEFINLIKNDKTFLEQEPFQIATKKKQLLAFKHNGFWQCMDTLRDKKILEKKIKEKKF